MGLILLVVCAWLLAASSEAQDPNPAVMDLANKNLDFATRLYRKIASLSDDNIFFSPLSVSALLTAMCNGARGATLDNILTGLGMKELHQEDQPDKIGNLFQDLYESVTQNRALQEKRAAAAFYFRQQVDVDKTFSDNIQRSFKVEVSKVDFSNVPASKDTINEYMNSATEGRVEEMVTDVDPQTQLLLISAILYHVRWELPFNTSFTQEERFFVNKYNIAQVPMMFRADKYYLAYDPSLKVGVLKLPLQGKAAMLILLPDKDVDYTSIDEELTSQRFLGWVKKLKKTKLEVQLPRFKLEQSYTMQKILKDTTLGINTIFEGNADLSRMSKTAGLKVSEMLHKAIIEVDEKGSAAPVTMAPGITDKSMPPRLTINRPFLFIIYHQVTKSLLFMGRVIDPLKN